nr:ABC transporter ATP-binding protein [Acuticoccus sediminis]
MERMVEIDGVSKAFGDSLAVREATFSVERGAFLTIVGPSGCGKTTLLRMIAGFERPTAGAIRINGADVKRMPAYRRSIGMVFQRLALFPHMTAAQNVAYPLKMRRFDPASIPERVERFLSLVRLDGLGDRRPHELSGGQQQRVAIARALVFDPDLLLLDEPLSALDRKLREEMQLEFRRIQQDLGVTTINVTHDQREALVMSDQIVVMNHGVVQQADEPQAIYRAPQNRFVATFVGVTSIFPARVVEADGAAVTVEAGGTRLTARGTGTLSPGDRVECTLRAEQVAISEGPLGHENTVTGTVAQQIFEGDRMVYAVTVEGLGGATIFVFDHDPAVHRSIPEGAAVTLGFAARDLFTFPDAETTTTTGHKELPS